MIIPNSPEEGVNNDPYVRLEPEVVPSVDGLTVQASETAEATSDSNSPEGSVVGTSNTNDVEEAIGTNVNVDASKRANTDAETGEIFAIGEVSDAEGGSPQSDENLPEIPRPDGGVDPLVAIQDQDNNDSLSFASASPDSTNVSPPEYAFLSKLDASSGTASEDGAVTHPSLRSADDSEDEVISASSTESLDNMEAASVQPPLNQDSSDWETSHLTESAGSTPVALSQVENATSGKSTQLQAELQQSKQKEQFLMEEVVRLQAELQQTQVQLVDLMNQRTAGEKPGVELEPVKALQQHLTQLIEAALRRDEEDHRHDQEELTAYSKQLERVLSFSIKLRQSMVQVIDECANSLLPTCRIARGQLTSDVQAQVQQRHDALELIGRMLDRLRESIEKLGESDRPCSSLPTASQQEFVDWLNDTYRERQASFDLAVLEAAIDKKLKEISNQRYQQITIARNLFEAQRNQLLSLVKQKIVPILDGLDDGQKNSRTILEDIKDRSPDQGERLKSWYSFHETLQQQLLDILKEIGIRQMDVQRGNIADYNRHFPMGVEADPTLQDEHVKEVVQQGYEYVQEDDSPVHILRPAQVIMVKN